LHGADPYAAVVYFYFSFSDQEKQNTENMLRLLIVQLCGRRPDTPKALLDLRRFWDVNHQPDLDSLETTLRVCIQDFKGVYVVIDALDEYPSANDERERLLSVLGRVVESALPNLHILCTSRPESDIKAKLVPLFSKPGTATIDLQKRQEEVNQDIRTYIDQKIEHSSNFRSWPPKVKEEVKATLTKKVDGM
jgi:ankyrin repeat domain-containing protein 50